MAGEPDAGDEYTAEEAERRAKATAHRLLNTPPKPHMTKREEAAIANAKSRRLSKSQDTGKPPGKK